MKLTSVLPDFASELSRGLADLGHPDLAGTIADVEIVELCPCSELGCVTFYAVPKADAPCWPECGRVIAPAKGVTCIHYRDGRIIWVEALGRPLDRAILDKLQSKDGAV